MKKGTVTLSKREQQRSKVLTLVLTGEITAVEAAVRLKLSLRQVRRLLAGFRLDGVAALAHGNRGRKPAVTLSESIRTRVLALAALPGYVRCNDSHLADLLAERESICVSRSTLQRWLRASGRPSPRQRRPPRFRKCRQRAPRVGLLVQIDASFHHWLGPDHDRFALIAAIDDATGRILSAHFRLQEDTEGYFVLLADMLQTHGVPGALYHDGRTTFIFTVPPRPSVEEELEGLTPQTQFARAAGQLSIGMIHARSPQAKGRIERLWNTLQDRLINELHLDKIHSMEAAAAYLPAFIERFNIRFGEEPAEQTSAFGSLPADLEIAAVCCRHHTRTVTGDNTVSVDSLRLQLPPAPRGSTHKGSRIQIQERLDRTWAIYRDGKCLAHPASLAPAKPVPLPPELSIPRPVSNPPMPNHPWMIEKQRTWIRRQEQLVRSSQ